MSKGYLARFMPMLALTACLILPSSDAQTISTVAGSATPGYSGDNGPATLAQLLVPDDIAFDSKGNYYIADDGNSVVRRVDGVTGVITTYAGSYTTVGGNTGDGGPATLATFNYPSGIAFDSKDNLYISDYVNDVVRRVDAVTKAVTRVVGQYFQNGYSGDGGPATLAHLNAPIGLRFDHLDNLFIADSNNSVIRRVDALTGDISTVAGNGTAGYKGDGGPATLAQLNGCQMVAPDPAGNLYISDFNNSVFRMVSASTGYIYTVAGSGVAGYSGNGGPATLARFSFDTGTMALGCGGDLYMTDDSNNVVRELVTSNGALQPVAGCATPGYSGDGGPATLARFNHTQSVAFDPAGDLLVVDYGNCCVRKVSSLCSPAPTWIITPTPSTTPTLTLTVTPTQTLTHTPTNTFTTSPTMTLSVTGTFTQTPSLTSSPSPTWTVTPSPSPSLTPSSLTPTPTALPCGDGLLTYAYPDPASGNQLSIFVQLCENGSGRIRVYDASLRLVSKIPISGNAGGNSFPLNLTGYSHGVYYYLVDYDGAGGKKISAIHKFAVTRSP